MSDDRTSVLIAGGGVAALEAALALRTLAEDRVRVELLAPEPQFWYRPLAVAEPFGLGQTRAFELAELAASAGATFSLGALRSVEAGARVVRTEAGGAFSYDMLLVACGANPTVAVKGAMTFRGPADTELIRRLLDEIVSGEVKRVAFAVPAGAVWALPLYELALMTGVYVAEHGLDAIELLVVTPESDPLQLFGPAAVEAIRKLLKERGISVQTDACAIEFADGELQIAPEGIVAADRVVGLPRLRGGRIDGLPQTTDGFIPINSHAQVHGFADVFAAGDITMFPVKQGGLATQQADAAAEMIAAVAGADLTPAPFRPVLRGLLLTGREPRYLRHEIGSASRTSAATIDPLWWPPAKVVGRYLAPFLASFVGLDSPPEIPSGSTLPIEVELDETFVAASRGLRRRIRRPPHRTDGEIVGGAMSTDFVTVAPEDTLGEVAEKMREREVGSAIVCDYGRLIGILTSRDLLHAVAGRVHPSEGRAREWMTVDPVAVEPEAELDEAVIIMTEFGFHHLPVVEGERPVGVLGLRQAMRKLREAGGVEGYYSLPPAR